MMQTQTDYIITRAKRALPDTIKRSPWSILNHGTELLRTENELNAYLAAYGEMHTIKCNAALQNFPFRRLPQRIQLIDWGCGQGLGALCFLDCLDVRGMINRVKKITLIEPSSAALLRATNNLKNAMSNLSCIINTKQLYLPTDEESIPSISELEMNLPGTVHIFSNILDIPSVSLSKTARLIENGEGMHFVICTSPLNTNATRLDEFAQFFSNQTVFSDISEKNFGLTSDYCHKFSCKTKGFYFNTADSKLNSSVSEGYYTEQGAFDDYNMEAMVKNGSLPHTIFKAYKTLLSNLHSSDRIFLRPDLNGDTPDIIVIRPGKGILVMNVFDGDITHCMFKNGAFQDNGITMISPLARVYSYRDNIINQHTSKILNKAITDRTAWYIVKPAIWFPNNNRYEINAVFAPESRTTDGVSVISGVNTIDAKSLSSSAIWDLLKLNDDNRSFSKDVCDQFLSVLKRQWHSFVDGDKEFPLTKAQRQLITKCAEQKYLRVKGVAGSGKTHVIAAASVACQLRTGRDVLILTYNITLANYIRSIITRIPADFYWNKFTITNYHSFFTTQAKNFNLKLNLESYDNPAFFDSVSEDLPKYSAVLIDEAQDYKTDWFEILFKNFLAEDGEVLIFGDDKQDVYRRRCFDRVPSVRKGHTWGPWNKLKLGYRLNNQHIINLALAFQTAFFHEPDEYDGSPTLSFGGGTAYKYLPFDTSANDLADLIIDYVKRYSIDNKDIVVLSQTTDILRNIEYAYRTKTGRDCMTSFETKEVYDKLLSISNGKIDSRFQQDLERIRANKKAFFSMASDNIKMSTIFSYKGWESECVVLIILPEPERHDALENRSELIYTAITRAKNYLFVINLGNVAYHNFFQENINNGIY